MLRGTRIITGEEAAIQRKSLDQMIGLAQFWGFQEVIIPSIWEQAPFVEKAGEEVLGQMYAFQDKKGRDICLIPEVTAIIQQQWRESWSKTWKKPSKIFYVNRCYRYERPQEGRYREFLQFGLEILGKPDNNQRDELLQIAESMVRTFAPDYKVNKTVKRGLSYYTEDGFEIEVPILGAQKQVCGGGRYAEGIGFAVGVDRLLLAKQLLDAEK